MWLHCYYVPYTVPKMCIRIQLHWSQKWHNTTVRTDSRQGSRNQKHYCFCQRLHWNRYDWNVISPDCLVPTKWVCFKQQSGQTPASVCIGFECRCNVSISMDTHVGWNVATCVCNVYPDKCWFAVLCQFWVQCSCSPNAEEIKESGKLGTSFLKLLTQSSSQPPSSCKPSDPHPS